MKEPILTCVNCADGIAEYKYIDGLFCPECLIDILLEDKIIEKAEYDPGIHGDYEEDN